MQEPENILLKSSRRESKSTQVCRANSSVLINKELGIGSNSEGVEVRSVGNTLTLKETALIEAFNLKAAIEYEMKNCKLQ
jgi:hypothetical protein